MNIKLIVGILGLLLVSPSVSAEEKENKQVINCRKVFFETAQCPPEACRYGCFDQKEGVEGCFMACVEKPCLQIPASHCPESYCQVLKGCEARDVCYPKLNPASSGCGTIGYYGQDVACCDGLVQRCGIEFFDGSCDMLAKKSIYSVPVCVPCGDKICGQFENRCNCPEDCWNTSQSLR